MASGSTPTYLIPYPLPTDPVNVASDIEELADRLEILFGNTVTASGSNTFTNTNIFSVNSASTAVRITQVGSGNALLVEDDANPDSSAFVVTNAGDVGIGKLSPGEKLDVAGNIKLTGNLIFEGASEDDYELSIVYTNPTADRTITLPDVTGTAITTGNLSSITSVGTITSGIWTGTTISAAYGGTGIASYGTGDLLYASASNALSALNIGTNGYVLTVSGGLPSWQPAAATVSAATPTVLGTVYGYTPSASSNIGLGYSALGTQSTSNDEHIAIGFESLLNIGSTAFADVMLGYKSGLGITTAGYNIGIGGWNFWGTTTGSFNIAIGYETLPAYKVGGLTGNNNIYIGGGAGYDSGPLITDNVAIGHTALYSSNNAYSVAIGNGALGSNTTGNGNTAVGWNAGTTITWGENNIVIGNNAQATAATISNEITIGNATNNRFRVPGLGIDWTPATVPSGTGGGDAKPQIFMLMGA